MNKRLKELAEQVGFPTAHGFVIVPEDLERFAELIVRECADAARKYIRDNEFSGEDISSYWLGDSIKEHFGVEP